MLRISCWGHETDEKEVALTIRVQTVENDKKQ